MLKQQLQFKFLESKQIFAEVVIKYVTNLSKSSLWQRTNNLNKVEEMFRFFGLKPKSSLAEIVGQRLNTRAEFPPLEQDAWQDTSRLEDPDQLSPAGKDLLLKSMVDYLLKHKQNEISQLQPDWAMGGTYGPAVNRLVADSEKDLEEHFQFQVRYTDMEWILISEMLHTLFPKDILHLTFDRHMSPHVHYTYEYNAPGGFRLLWKKLGISGIWQVAKLMLKAPKADFSHRKDHQLTVDTAAR